MKKKNVLIILLFASTIVVAKAQIFQIGMRAGISSSTIKVDDVVQISAGEQYTLESGDPSIGFHIGAISRITFFNVYVQPELLFSSTGGEVKITDAEGIEDFKEQDFNKIDIPVTMGMKFGPARVGLGPVASIVLSGKDELFDTKGYNEKFNHATFGYQVGVGLDLMKLAIDLKYEGNFSRLGDGVEIDGKTYNFDTRNQQFIFSLGYFF